MRLLIITSLLLLVFCPTAKSQPAYQPVEKTSLEVDTQTVRLNNQSEFMNTVTGKPVKIIHKIDKTGFHFYNSVRFKSKNEGVIAGGSGLRIRVTKDGGLHWQSFSFSRFANAFYSTAINDGNIYVVGASRYIFRSKDFGDSWEVFDVSTLGENKYVLRHPTFYKIKFGADESGMIVGENNDKPIVLKTTDNGNSWHLTETEELQKDERLISDAVLLSNQTIRAVTSKGNVYERTDGAQTWALLHEGKKGESLNSIAFKNKQEGYVSGLNGLLLRTTDGGNTWKRINTDALRRNANISNIKYISENSVLITTAKSFQGQKFKTFAFTVDEKGQINPFILRKDAKAAFTADAYGFFVLKDNVFLLDRNNLYRTFLK